MRFQTTAEIETITRWKVAHLGPESMSLPFSFIYDGKPSCDLLKTWDPQYAQTQLGDHRLRRTLTYSDPKTGLRVRCVSVEYDDYPVVEWTLYFKNTSDSDTPILSDISAIDIDLHRAGSGEFILHHHTGDNYSAGSYEPHDEIMSPGAVKRLAPTAGRPTDEAFPYFNIEWPGEGAIVVLSWAGQWAAEFSRDSTDGLHIRGGQELTHFALQPGEEVRSPMAVVQFYKGDKVRAQNIWRRWMLAHNVPKPHGKLPEPMSITCDGGHFPGLFTSEAGEKQFIDIYVKENIKPDYWWLDAGWYSTTGADWSTTGTWEVDKNRFPNGIRALSDYVHDLGMKLIVWFEPERVVAKSWLAENHPEWLLKRDNPTDDWVKNNYILNLGNPEAWQWLVNHIDGLLVSEGIDLYRQDFNIDPLLYWRDADSPDRQGITEIKHVMGYYAYWDELHRRHLDMLIDSCASGGRRNDLETLRRALPLLRSDYQFYAVGNQGHTYGLSSWIPFYGTGVQGDEYTIRSHFCSCFGIGVDVREEGNDYDLLRRLMADWRKVVGTFLGDYYPLTSYSQSNDVWIAWQFDVPENGKGSVQAFRRADNADVSICLKMQGLDPEARYSVIDLDTGKQYQSTGSELMERGLTVTANAPSAKIFTYEKQ